MFVEIDTLEKAKPLSEAGLLWYRFPLIEYTDDYLVDTPGYWTHYEDRNQTLWDKERAGGCRYYILLEE